ncbi:MAG: G5 domain-containing protein [Clostridia bacterium]|nr:G5 domain-containing protein [Clostridia bacterium]
MRKNKKRLFVGSLFAVLCVMVMCLTACSQSQSVKVEIYDSGTTTEADANTDMTVKDILKSAGITLNDKDETKPKADDKIGEETKITVNRYAKVTVVKGSEQKTVELVGGKVEDAVQKAGFNLGDGVVCSEDKSAYLKNGMTITLTSSLTSSFKVSLTDKGKTSKVETKAETVKAFLEEQKIKLGENDEISPKTDTKISDGLKIKITRVEFKEKTENESVDFTVEEQQDETLNQGETKVIQDGVKGEKTIKYKVKYIDGKESTKEKISEDITKEPVNKIVAVGTKIEVSQSEVPQEQESQPSVVSETPQESSQAVQSSQPESSQPESSQPESSQPESSQPESSQSEQGGKKVVSKQKVYDCDGSGHGYYIITYDDGSVEYEDF